MLDKNWAGITSIPVAISLVLIICFVLSSPTFGYSKEIFSSSNFRDFPPMLLRTEDGEQYKFDIDILQDAGHNTGEPSTLVNHQAKGDVVKLKKGEQVTLDYGSPFGFGDYIKGSLLKGRVVTYERLNEKVDVFGIQTVFLQSRAPPEGVQAQIPPTVRVGHYDLVILLTYNEEIRGYYITNAIVS